MSRTAKALTGQLDSLHERSSIVRAGCDSERLDANWVRTAPTELLPAIAATSNDRQCRALGGDRQAMRPFADRIITDGFGGRVQRRGVAPRQEHDNFEPEGPAHRLCTGLFVSNSENYAD